jgi:hypothetical protein
MDAIGRGTHHHLVKDAKSGTTNVKFGFTLNGGYMSEERKGVMTDILDSINGRFVVSQRTVCCGGLVSTPATSLREL